jgi:hypothetical protein
MGFQAGLLMDFQGLRWTGAEGIKSRERTRSPVAASPGVSAARLGSFRGSDLGVSPGIYSTINNIAGPGCTRGATMIV